MEKRRQPYGRAVELTLDVLGGKWKTVIVARLKHGSMQYGELRRTIPGLSDKMLSQRLRDLVEAGLVSSGCENGGLGGSYSVTKLGRSLGTSLEALYAWAGTHAAPLGAPVRGVTVDVPPSEEG